MVKWFGKKQYLRPIVHISSLLYLAVLFFLVVNQQSFIQGITQKYFKINIQSVLLLFSSEDWLTSLQEQAKQMGIELAILAGSQIIFIILGLILIGYLLWRLKRIDRWHLSEKLLIAGYLFLVISLVTILVKMGMEVSQTYNTVNHRINSLSVSELQAFQDKLSEIFLNSSFSLDQLVSNILSLIDQIRGLIQKTKKIAGIPDLLQQSWAQILILKNWLVGCSIGAVAIILVGHVVEGIRMIKDSQYLQNKFNLHHTKRVRQIELNERLVEVIEQQQVLIERLSEDKIISDDKVKEN